MKSLWGLILLVATLAGSPSAQTHTAIIPLSPDGEPGVGLTGEGDTRSHTFFRSDGNERVAVWEADAVSYAPYTLEYTEFVYVLEGSLMLTDARGRKETFRPGEAVLLPRGTEVTWEQDERMREYYVIFDVEESDEESSASEESPVKAPRPSDNSELMNRFRSRLQASGSRSPPKLAPIVKSSRCSLPPYAWLSWWKGFQSLPSR